MMFLVSRLNEPVCICADKQTALDFSGTHIDFMFLELSFFEGRTKPELITSYKATYDKGDHEPMRITTNDVWNFEVKDFETQVLVSDSHIYVWGLNRSSVISTMNTTIEALNNVHA